jgi:hypothetical protein
MVEIYHYVDVHYIDEPYMRFSKQIINVI